jgi:polysaccharide export outer membrane protein
VCAAFGGGCQTVQPPPPDAVTPVSLPRELNKVTQPDYMIEPPDVLLLDLLVAVPKAPYKIRPLDVLAVRATGTLPDAPVQGQVTVEPDGTINLGPPYGTVSVVGLSVDEARKAVEKALKREVREPLVAVSLVQSRGQQQVRGPHLVRPDGTVGLGTYGSVRVVGLTLAQAKAKLEEHLSQYFEAPEVAVEISGYNSKVYYVIYDGAGAGQQIVRQPITGNETVLDAVSQIGSFPTVGDRKKVWIARPAPDGNCTCQTLPVDWRGITECGDTRTNYQLMPGDRIFVNSYKSVQTLNTMNRVFGPIERALGFTLLGTSAYQNFRFIDQPGFGFGGGFGR